MIDNQTNGNNIFKLVAVANKELAHSSMLKFILDNSNKIGKTLFNISSENTKVFLEKSGKMNKKTVRFDLVIAPEGTSEDDALKNPVTIIENKYKSTPTTKQLELYDKYLKSIESKANKVLMVFSSEQVPSDVKKHCDTNSWTIVPYFSFYDEECLLKSLKSFDYKKLEKKLKYLLEDYRTHLENSFMAVTKLINSDSHTLNYNKDERESWAFFLYYILGQVSKELESKGYNGLSINNDGGKNKVPSIAVWFKSNSGYSHYVGIDGKSLKFGFLYIRSQNNQNYVDLITTQISKIDSIKNLGGKYNNRKLKSKGDSISVHSLYGIDLTSKEWSKKSLTSSEVAINNFVKVFEEYYKLVQETK